MLKLKKIISHIDDGLYKSIEDNLIKNKADNFLYLYRSYRHDVVDNEIIKGLNLSHNSYYVLKSRLYDKIQHHISGDVNIAKEDILKRLDLLPEMSYKQPREVLIPYLEKIEADLLRYDMHSELLTVYSTLKKVHLFSDKYFHYTRLFNKHVALYLSIEKSEEILGNFNRILGQYNFSKSQQLLDTLLFIRTEIANQLSLNPSRQIEIIANLIEVQLNIFCEVPLLRESNVEDLLEITRDKIADLPISSSYKYWNDPLDYLNFEYYLKTNQMHYAAIYYELINIKFQNLLLYTSICCTSNFFISKIVFLQDSNRVSELVIQPTNNFYIDPVDAYSIVLRGIYASMINFYKGDLKGAAANLNELLNEHTFREYFHIAIQIRLTLAFFYIRMNVLDLAENIIISISRKIKTEKYNNYQNVVSLLKVFDLEIKGRGRVSDKQRDYFALFLARNTQESKILKHLLYELNKKYR